MDIKLTKSSETSLINPIIGDIYIDNGQMVFVLGKEFIAQKLRIKFQFFKGEWYLDQREGFPYWERVFKKNPNVNEIASLFRRCAYDTPGVASVRSVDVTVDVETRLMSVSIDVVTDDNEIIKWDNEPFILSI